SAAMRYRPRHPEALLERAKIYMRQGEYEKAIDDLSTILDLVPGSGEVRFARALAYKALEQHGRAADDLIHLVRLFQPNQLPGWQHYSLYATLGHCLARVGRHEDAIRYYSGALEVHPTSLLALVERGQAHLELEANDRALADFSAAIEHWPTSPEA